MPDHQAEKNTDECVCHAKMFVDFEQVRYEEVPLDVTHQGSGVVLVIPFEYQRDSIKVQGQFEES